MTLQRLNVGLRHSRAPPSPSPCTLVGQKRNSQPRACRCPCAAGSVPTATSTQASLKGIQTALLSPALLCGDWVSDEAAGISLCYFSVVGSPGKPLFSRAGYIMFKGKSAGGTNAPPRGLMFLLQTFSSGPRLLSSYSHSGS